MAPEIQQWPHVFDGALALVPSALSGLSDWWRWNCALLLTVRVSQHFVLRLLEPIHALPSLRLGCSLWINNMQSHEDSSNSMCFFFRVSSGHSQTKITTCWCYVQRVDMGIFLIITPLKMLNYSVESMWRQSGVRFQRKNNVFSFCQALKVLALHYRLFPQTVKWNVWVLSCGGGGSTIEPVGKM